MGDEKFKQRLDRYAATSECIWRARSEPGDWGAPVPLEDKLTRESSSARHLKVAEALLRQRPASPARRPKRWREGVLAETRTAARECLAFPESGIDLLFTSTAMDAASQFVEEARAFDPEINDKSLLQAMRNVWVVHALQIFLDAKIALSPAIFAYSMLYPYTDNPLDDPGLSMADKARLGNWLEQRLHGIHSAPPGSRAEPIDRLIGMIEASYPRRDYPEVYQSLLAIHAAQIESLLQQQVPASIDKSRLLEITVRKGGSSVLVDGYLVRGALSAEEGEFFYLYGVLLQLMDDLQDFRDDRTNGHHTLFGSQSSIGFLDEITSRLWGFIETVLWRTSCFGDTRYAPLKRLIQENCKLLIMHSVATNQKHYSREFAEFLEARSLFRFSYLRTREQALVHEYKKLLTALPQCVPAKTAGSQRAVRRTTRVPLNGALNSHWPPANSSVRCLHDA
jgi:hypothetical protein